MATPVERGMGIVLHATVYLYSEQEDTCENRHYNRSQQDDPHWEPPSNGFGAFRRAWLLVGWQIGGVQCLLNYLRPATPIRTALLSRSQQTSPADSILASYPILFGRGFVCQNASAGCHTARVLPDFAPPSWPTSGGAFSFHDL